MSKHTCPPPQPPPHSGSHLPPLLFSVDLLLFKVFFQVKTNKNKGNEAIFCILCNDFSIFLFLVSFFPVFILFFSQADEGVRVLWHRLSFTPAHFLTVLHVFELIIKLQSDWGLVPPLRHCPLPPAFPFTPPPHHHPFLFAAVLSVFICLSLYSLNNE